MTDTLGAQSREYADQTDSLVPSGGYDLNPLAGLGGSATLADTHGSNGAAVVLSGTSGDGAIGIKRIKERGGLTVAQDPGEAEHHEMPRATIATGMVDWVLPAAAMEVKFRLPSGEGHQPAQPAQAAEEAELTVDQELKHKVDMLGHPPPTCRT